MCSADEHKEIIGRNLEFIGFVASKRSEAGKFNEWLCVAYFYCAIHDCESYFAEKNFHSRNHSDREMIIRELPRMNWLNSRDVKNLIKAYFSLRYNCNRARYDGVIMLQEDIDNSKGDFILFKRLSSTVLPAIKITS